MELIEWMGVAEAFYQAFSLSLRNEYGMNWLALLLCLAAAAAVYAVCIVFGGIGLRTMAKKAGVKNSWLAFVPFANTYFAGKFAQDANLFGKKIKNVGVWAMLVEILHVAIFLYVFVMKLLLSPYYQSTFVEGEFISGYANIPETMKWMVVSGNICSAFSYFFSLVLIFFFAVLYTAVYRKYYPRNPLLMTLFSAVFPGRGFILFALRNNEAVDYNEYMRRRMEAYRARQGGYGSDYSAQQQQNQQQSDPYNGEFGTAQEEDPFSEFSDNDGANGDQN